MASGPRQPDAVRTVTVRTAAADAERAAGLGPRAAAAGAPLETSLLDAIDAVFTRHERLWQESKHEAIQALSAGFADKMARVKTELLAKDATVSSISRYFERWSPISPTSRTATRRPS